MSERVSEGEKFRAAGAVSLNWGELCAATFFHHTHGEMQIELMRARVCKLT